MRNFNVDAASKDPENSDDKTMIEPRATYKRSVKPTLKMQRCLIESNENQDLCDDIDTSPQLNIPKT